MVRRGALPVSLRMIFCEFRGQGGAAGGACSVQVLGARPLAPASVVTSASELQGAARHLSVWVIQAHVGGSTYVDQGAACRFTTGLRYRRP